MLFLIKQNWKEEKRCYEKRLLAVLLAAALALTSGGTSALTAQSIDATEAESVIVSESEESTEEVVSKDEITDETDSVPAESVSGDTDTGSTGTSNTTENSDEAEIPEEESTGAETDEKDDELNPAADSQNEADTAEIVTGDEESSDTADEAVEETNTDVDPDEADAEDTDSLSVSAVSTTSHGGLIWSLDSKGTLTINSGTSTVVEAYVNWCDDRSSVKKIVLGEGITELEESAFSYYTKLTSVTFPTTLTKIDSRAFYYCTSLESVTIPGSVSKISDSAFEYCYGLKYLYLSDGVTKIGPDVFHCCSDLIIVRIPKSVISIGTGAFGSCISLEDGEVYYGGSKSKWSSISIGSGNSYLESATFTYNSKTSVVIPRTDVTALQIVSTGVKVRWDQSYGAKGYIIYRKTSGGSYSRVGKVTGGSTLTYTDTTAEKNKTYYYKVKAYSGSVKSNYGTSTKDIQYLKSTVTTVKNPSAVKTDNRGWQDYMKWSDAVCSYLVPVDSGFMRVEYTISAVVVEYYNSNWKLTSQKKIACELDKFGGFYAGEDAYYLVFGQTNPNESDDKEVIRVVKYSTGWVRKSNASVYGADTYIPFDAGSLSMTEYKGYLYIRTCHENYAKSDGLHHQSNMSIQVKESDMTVISDSSMGYVSHSFNQYIITDDKGNIIGADHGDACPRSITLSRMNYSSRKDNGWYTDCDSADVFEFQGSTGQNYTGATLGGLEYSSSSYLTVGSSVRQNSNWSSNSQYNIFVTVTSRSDFSSSGTTRKWITTYAEGANVAVSNPQLVKISNSKFLLMWVENSTTLKYVFLNAKGEKTSSIYSAKAVLSDCQPVYSNGYVYWYVTGNSSYDTKPKLYAIKVSKPSAVLATSGSLTAPTMGSVSNASKGVKISWTGSYKATGYIIYRKSGDGSYKKLKKIKGATTTTYTDTSAKSGTTYTYKVIAYKTSGGKTKKSSYSSAKSVTYLAAGKISSLTNTSSGIKVKWSKVSKAAGYYVYRKTSSGSYKKIATIKKNSTTSYTDKAVKSKNGTTYTYKVVPYSGSTKGSFVSKTTVRLTGTSVSSANNTSSKTMTVKWSKKSGVTGYQVQYATNSDFTKGKVTKSVSGASTVSKKLTGLTKGKAYYVRVRIYKTVDGKKYYSAWSSGKKVKISK